MPLQAEAPQNLEFNRRFMISPEEMVRSLFQRAQYVFVGENHAINDETVFAGMVDSLAKMGVANLTVEVPVDLQQGLEGYLRGGDLSTFGLARLSILTGWLDLVQRVNHSGIRIVCMDQPRNQKLPRDLREQFMAEQLAGLDGKTLIWTGTQHSPLDQNPYPTTRTILEMGGFATAGIHLESLNGAKRFAAVHPEKWPAFTYNATRVFFGDTKIVPENIGYPTHALGDLKFLEPTPDPLKANVYLDDENWVLYREAYDGIIFLSPADSTVVERNKP